VGPPQYPARCGADQEPWRRFRARRCLLKGCERRFRPCHPQVRYCSEGCRHAARRWRRWHASQHYRASTQGKERRRAQSRRYRERLRQQVAARVANVPGTAPADAVPQSEGQRAAQPLANFAWRPCCRPGCYELFPVRSRSPGQRFCSCSCRQALRRVLDREAHWRRRQRCRRVRRLRPSRQRPDSS
jgi:hypothetical protein